MRAFIAFVVISTSIAIAAPEAQARSSDPYRFSTKTYALAQGVSLQTMVRKKNPLVVHVAKVQPGAPFELRAVLAHGQLMGSKRGLQRTSDMCRWEKCLVAVNGDFFGPLGNLIGGVVSSGEIVRSPTTTHLQFAVLPEGGFQAGPMGWAGSLSATESATEVKIHGVNVVRDRDRAVLYTPRHGATTRTNKYGAELILRVVNPSGPLQLGQLTVVRLDGFRFGGNTPIPRDGAVVSAHGSMAAALAALWHDAAGANGALKVASDGGDVSQTIGGTPIIMRNGKRWFANNRSLWRTRAPRTIVGWNKKGELFLVTVDGRQPKYSVGMSLAEVVRLMQGLGATEAINLDGGGSTTFVSRGRVINRPSDRIVKRGKRRLVVHVPRKGDRVLALRERPVANALVLVPMESTMSASVRDVTREDRAPLVPTTGVLAWMTAATAWAFYIRRRTKMVVARR